MFFVCSYSYETFKDTLDWIHLKYFLLLYNYFLNASPKLIVTEKTYTPTPSTLIITLKLLATNESCEKQQFFEQRQTPALKSWLFYSI